MAANISRSVGDLPPDDKHSLEQLLGQPLKATERIYIVAFDSHEPPVATRQTTANAIEKTLDRADEHAQASRVTDDDIDAAVDEAMEQVRRREPDESRS